jgi:hypothetical protein
MSDDGIARVHYFEQQFLRTQDFTDEQAYHLAMRRRHNIAHHISGIVFGLELVVEEQGAFVGPGMAIDGYGRELIVPEKQPLPMSAFDDIGADKLDVWLVYDRIGSEQAPEGYAGCGNGYGVSYYRWQERPVIQLDKPQSDVPRRQPESVPLGDLDFDPSRTPPDDPQEDWPVFLGQIQRERPNSNQPYAYTADLSNRPYAALRGETIVAPSGRTQVQIGAEKESDERRFAVFIPETNSPHPSLEINKYGQVDVGGNTALHGDLLLKGRSIVFRAGTACSPDTSSWRIYYCIHEPRDGQTNEYAAKETSDEAGGEPDTPTDALSPPPEHQLRIAMPAGAGFQDRVVIGAWSTEDKLFKDCLSVRGDGTVVIHGDLVVKGGIHDTIEREEREFSAEAKRLLQAGVLSGIGGANLQLERFYRRLGLYGLESPGHPSLE